MPYRFTYGAVDKTNGDKTNGDALLSEIFALRYQVYVTEWGFESPVDHPEGLEYDEFDKHAVHIFARSNLGEQIIGSVRMILDSPIGFPVEKNFDIAALPAGIDRHAVAEISRLAVSKQFRQRDIDRKIFGSESLSVSHVPRYMDNARDFRRHCEHQLVRGLYITLYRNSKRLGLTHWYAVMAKGLYLILKRWGISFVQIGAARDYHGLRAPYLVSIASIEETIGRLDPGLLQEARSGLGVRPS